MTNPSDHGTRADGFAARFHCWYSSHSRVASSFAPSPPAVGGWRRAPGSKSCRPLRYEVSQRKIMATTMVHVRVDEKTKQRATKGPSAERRLVAFSRLPPRTGLAADLQDRWREPSPRPHRNAFGSVLRGWRRGPGATCATPASRAARRQQEDRSRPVGGPCAHLVRHDTPVRRRQRSHCGRDRGHGAREVLEQPPAVLYRVGANPDQEALATPAEQGAFLGSDGGCKAQRPSAVGSQPLPRRVRRQVHDQKYAVLGKCSPDTAPRDTPANASAASQVRPA